VARLVAATCVRPWRLPLGPKDGFRSAE